MITNGRRLIAILFAVLIIGASVLINPSVGVSLMSPFRLIAHAYNYSGTCGNNLKWSLDTNDGILVITGTGSMNSYLTSRQPWYDVRDYITRIQLPDGLSGIESRAFSNLSNLYSVTIPDTVSYINFEAFSDCSRLMSITIPDSVRYIYDSAFKNCSMLRDVQIPENARRIDDEAFYGCTSLKSISIPKNAELGEYVFLNCTNLQSIIVDKENMQYLSEDGVLYNKDKTCLIQYPAGKTNEEFSVPNGVLTIENYAFCGSSLIAINLPNSVFGIGAAAFKNCIGLSSFCIPDGVPTIKWDTFWGCSNLQSVTIPRSVKSIGNEAFERCYSLKDVYCSLTEKEWKYNVDIGRYNSGLLYANFHFHVHEYSSVFIQPTCTKIGGTFFTCESCGYSYVMNPISTIPHEYDAGVSTPPTCLENGFLTFTCLNCESTYVLETESALGHDYDLFVFVPTCEEKGFIKHICSRCGDSYVSDETAALGHVWDAGTVTTVATCTEAGVRTFTCRNDSSHTKTESIPAKGHSFGAWTQTTAPTVYAQGVETQYCANCTATNTRSIPKLSMPKVVIQNFTASSKAYDYRSSITFKADVDNKLSGGQIHWFVDGKDVGTGGSYTAENVKQSFSLQAKYYVDGKEIPETATETEKVNVNTGFFARLKAFFLGLFGLLPKVTQEYLGVKIYE